MAFKHNLSQFHLTSTHCSAADAVAVVNKNESMSPIVYQITIMHDRTAVHCAGVDWNAHEEESKGERIEQKYIS